jgi:hypothetical protein
MTLSRVLIRWSPLAGSLTMPLTSRARPSPSTGMHPASRKLDRTVDIGTGTSPTSGDHVRDVASAGSADQRKPTFHMDTLTFYMVICINGYTCHMGSQDGVIVPTSVISGFVMEDDLAKHYSTGRLTCAQAATVNAWRARLRLDKPLPGQQPVGAVVRMLGGDDRPCASCSDAVAAATADLLLRQPPEPLELARYAYASMQAAKDAGRIRNDEAPLYPPVSWYLPGQLRTLAERLRASSLAAVIQIHDDAEVEAVRLYPGRTGAVARGLHVTTILARAALPFTRQVPRGAIARMAIDLWGSRHPDDVAAIAVAYAAEVHQQPHRARRDMRTLARLDASLATTAPFGPTMTASFGTTWRHL